MSDTPAKKKKRGSVNNKRRLDAFKKDVKTEGADWRGCDPKWLQEVIGLVTELGGAVTFGTSRDQGAHSLALMLEGERETLWFNGGADLDDELANVSSTLEAMK